MPEEANEAPDHRALLDVLGYPPIRGGAEDEPEADESDTPDAPEPETEDGTRDEPDAPDTPDESQVDYEQRYNDLRPEYDRSQQVLAALQGRHGPDAQAEVAEALGLQQGEETEPDDEYDDPEERIERLESYLAEQEQYAERDALQQAEAHWLTDNLSQLEKKEGVELSDDERDIIKAVATANRFEDDQPDIEGAYKRHVAAAEAQHKRYLASKQAPKVGVGTAGQKKIDLSDPDIRRQHMAEIMEAESGES